MKPILLILLWLAIFAGPLQARCAPATAFVSPEETARVPPDPTLYLFEPSWFEVGDLVAVGDQGQPLRLNLEPVAGAPAYRVFRLRVHTEASSSFVISTSDQSLRPHEYTVAPGWSPASQGALEPVKIEQEKHRWTCSYQRTANLTVERRNPAAYRVEWADSREDYLADVRDSVLIPPDPRRFFTNRSEDERSVDVIELGHVNCLGLTMKFSDTPLYVGIVALYPDGTETLSVEEPKRVRIRAPAWLDSQ